MFNPDDEIAKDQGEGFQWWWGRDKSQTITHSGIVDLFPLNIHVPTNVLAHHFKPYLSIIGHAGEASLYLYPSAADEGDRRSFLSNRTNATNQVAFANQGIHIGNKPQEISYGRGDSELQQHSWCSWFNKASSPSIVSLAGKVYRSYVGNDKALYKWMHYNDNLKRGSVAFINPIAPKWHYSRGKLTNYPPEWRGPIGIKTNDTWGKGQSGKSVVNTLSTRIPSMMLEGHRKPFYGYKDINLPVGTVEHPFENSVNYNANAHPDEGWRDGQHSDFVVGESGDASNKMWFPEMWNWFNEFVRKAIKIGEE